MGIHQAGMLRVREVRWRVLQVCTIHGIAAIVMLALIAVGSRLGSEEAQAEHQRGAG